MKKFYKVTEKKPGTYRKKPVWKIEMEDLAAIGVVVLVVGYVCVRSLIG